MKNVCLENYGVSKLETHEAKAVNGGIPWLVTIVVGAIVVEVINDWDHFKDGLYAGFN